MSGNKKLWKSKKNSKSGKASREIKSAAEQHNQTSAPVVVLIFFWVQKCEFKDETDLNFWKTDFIWQLQTHEKSRMWNKD